MSLPAPATGRMSPDMRRLAPGLIVLATLACQAPEATSEGSGKTDAEASSADAATKMVPYDLRRLRPREQEKLAAMFERLRAQALAEDKRVIVFFSADWCEPCRNIELELGNVHPAGMIGDVRIIELKEDDWSQAARMDEFNGLRRRWEPVLNTYPLLILLDAEGERVEEMKEAATRLEEAGLDPTLPVWFEESRTRS